MKLTTEVLAAYKGGQLEIQHPDMGYVFRGEIKDAKVEDGTLMVEFAWLGKAPYPPLTWKSQDELNYALSLLGCGVNRIEDNRLAAYSQVSGELLAFYPPGGSRLDPNRVEGLEPIPAWAPELAQQGNN